MCVRSTQGHAHGSTNKLHHNRTSCCHSNKAKPQPIADRTTTHSLFLQSFALFVSLSEVLDWCGHILVLCTNDQKLPVGRMETFMKLQHMIKKELKLSSEVNMSGACTCETRTKKKVAKVIWVVARVLLDVCLPAQVKRHHPQVSMKFWRSLF